LLGGNQNEKKKSWKKLPITRKTYLSMEGDLQARGGEQKLGGKKNSLKEIEKRNSAGTSIEKKGILVVVQVQSGTLDALGKRGKNPEKGDGV